MLQTRLTKLTDVYEYYILDGQARKLSPSTLQSYHDRVKRFLDWCETQNIHNLTEITSNTIRSYIVFMQNEKRAEMTIANTFGAIKAFINFCVREELITVAPTAKVQRPKVGRYIITVLEPEQVQKILKACRTERDEAIFLFMLDCGVRAAEMVALDGRDIDLKTGTVFVRQGKGGRDRFVYIGAKARKSVQRYYLAAGVPGNHDPVWRSLRTGERLSDSGLRQVVRETGQLAGIEDCHPHMLRRTFATWSLQAGMSIFHLAKLMGHQTEEVLRHYLGLSQKQIEQSSRQHGAVDRTL